MNVQHTCAIHTTYSGHVIDLCVCVRLLCACVWVSGWDVVAKNSQSRQRKTRSGLGACISNILLVQMCWWCLLFRMSKSNVLCSSVRVSVCMCMGRFVCAVWPTDRKKSFVLRVSFCKNMRSKTVLAETDECGGRVFFDKCGCFWVADWFGGWWCGWRLFCGALVV